MRRTRQDTHCPWEGPRHGFYGGPRPPPRSHRPDAFPPRGAQEATVHRVDAGVRRRGRARPRDRGFLRARIGDQPIGRAWHRRIPRHRIPVRGRARMVSRAPGPSGADGNGVVDPHPPPSARDPRPRAGGRRALPGARRRCRPGGCIGGPGGCIGGTGRARRDPRGNAHHGPRSGTTCGASRRLRVGKRRHRRSNPCSGAISISPSDATANTRSSWATIPLM